MSRASQNGKKLLFYGLEVQGLPTELLYLPPPFDSLATHPPSSEITLYSSWSVKLCDSSLHLEIKVFMPGRRGH